MLLSVTPMRMHTASGPNLGPLTFEEYEDIYRETLLCLAEQFSVGDPFVNPSGNRLCMIGGFPLNDDEVLKRWWGDEIGDEIHRLASVGSSSIN